MILLTLNEPYIFLYFEKAELSVIQFEWRIEAE